MSCPQDLQQYLTANRSKMAALNESGVPLQLMCDVTAALAHLHSAGYSYGSEHSLIYQLFTVQNKMIIIYCIL